MAHKLERTSVLHFDSHGVSWLRAEKSAVGSTVVEQECERGDWTLGDALEQALRAFVARHGIGADRVVSVFPRYDVTTRILALPSHEHEEIASMIRLSAEEFVPYGAEELIIDHSVLRLMPNGEASVFAVLAHRDMVERHLSVLAAAGIEPQQVYLSSACLVNCALAAVPEGRYGVVHLASGGFELVVVNGGRLAYSRGVASGQDWEGVAKDPTAGGGLGLIQESPVDELAAEIRSSLASYRRDSEDGEGVEMLYVGCDGVDVFTLCRHLSDALGKECRPASFGRDVGVLGKVLDRAPLAALGALLAVEGAVPVTISLLPERIAAQRQRQSSKRLALRIALFAACLFIALGGLYWQALNVRKRVVEELRGRVQSMEPNARGIAEKREQLTILRRQVDRKGSIVEQLATVVDALPEGRANITRISLDREEGISIWGRTKAVDDVAEFAQNLRNKASAGLAFFAKARTVYEQKAVEQELPVSTYQVDIPIEDDKDGK